MNDELQTLVGEELESFVDGHQILITWPGIPFDPSKIPLSTTAYLKASISQIGEPDVHLVGGEATYLWLVQIMVGIRDGKGEMPGLKIIKELRRHFPFDKKFEGFGGNYGVRSPLTTAPSLTERGWIAIPTSFQVYTIQ